MQRDRRQILTEYLVHQAQSGDVKAFQQLHELWHSKLNQYAAVRIQHAQSLGDVMQEIWIHIARSLRKLDDPACFPRWAFQIVSRRSADWIRKEQRNRKRQKALNAEPSRVLPSTIPSVYHNVLTNDLKSALASLPENQREILYLFYLAGLDITHVAEILELPKGTVKSRLFNARAHLKQILSPHK